MYKHRNMRKTSNEEAPSFCPSPDIPHCFEGIILASRWSAWLDFMDSKRPDLHEMHLDREYKGPEIFG
jgi:hypothetical protein